MENVLCIYHGNCADGFTAAWVLKQAIPNAEFVAAAHGGAIPDVRGKHVFMLDFMYPPEKLLAIAILAESVLILDHHKTSMEGYNTLCSSSDECSGVVEFKLGDHTLDTWRDHLSGLAEEIKGLGTMSFIYAGDLSGAGLAWKFFFPRLPMPRLVAHVQDRDLWRFQLPYTREFQSYLFSHPYDFNQWSRIHQEAELTSAFNQMVEQGEAIDRKAAKDIDELLGVCTRYMDIGGFNVPVASLPYTMVSDAAQRLYERHGAPFAACYWDTATGRVFGLRSPKGGIDVGAIAKSYGGGGHENASGFTVDRDHDLAKG